MTGGTRRGWIAVVGIVAVSGALAWQLAGTVNHDSAWLLYATHRVLDGARLYVDVFENNPPLIVYLTAPPVLASRVAGLGLATGWVLYVLALAAGALCGCLAVTRRARAGGGSHWTPLLAGAGVAALFVPLGSFGQREHIAVLAGLPYVFALAARASGREVPGRAAALAGIAAGVGFALKPWFLLVPLLLEAREAWRRRTARALLRPESIALVSVVALYAASVPILHPEYLERIVPVALATYDRGYGTELPALLAQKETLLGVALLGVWAIGRRGLSRPAAPDTFGIAAAGFFGAWLWQLKGFPYHLTPTLALLLPPLAAIVRAGPATGPGGLLRRPRRAAAALGAAALVGAMFAGGPYPSTRGTPLFEVVTRRTAPGGSIAALGSVLTVGFPLALDAGVGWGSRFPTLWPVPGAWRGLHGDEATTDPAERAELRGILEWVRSAVAEDLQTFRPDLVLVDASGRKEDFGGMPFDWVAWASRSPRFRAAWSPYRRVERVGPVEVWARVSEAPPGAARPAARTDLPAAVRPPARGAGP